MEKDDEVKGRGNSYDFGARMYDSRLGRWLTIDPLAGKYPSLSPYNFVGNSPLIFVDPDGRKIIVGDAAQQAVVLGYLRDQFGYDMYKFDRKGELKLDKKVFKGVKSGFTQEQIDISIGLAEVIKSDRIIQVMVYKDKDINFTRNPLVPIQVRDPESEVSRTEYYPIYEGRGIVMPELKSEAKTILIEGDNRAFVLINQQESNFGVFEAEDLILSGKAAMETGMYRIKQTTNPSASSVFIHEVLDHGLDYVRTGSLNEPADDSKKDNVNFHNKALKNKGSVERTGGDHDE